MSKPLSIKAKVINFVENAMHFNFRTQPCHFYDATLLEILEPPELAGKKLSIYHDKNNRVDSLWHQVDSVLVFNINQDLLMQSDAIFTGAAQELHSCSS